MSNSSAGVALLLFSLVCLGTWPALLDLSSLRGRHETHSYLDYATTVFAVATVVAVVASLVDGVSLIATLESSSALSAGLAASGGLLLMLGNLSMQRALLMNVPLTIVLPLQGSLCVVIGTSANYALQPEANDPRILFFGVGTFLAAIVLSTAAHLTHQQDAAQRRAARRRRHRIAARGSSSSQSVRGTVASGDAGTCCAPWQPLLELGDQDFRIDPPRASDDATAGEADGGTGSRGPAADSAPYASAAAGLCVAACGGFCFGGFSPLFNLAVNDEFGWTAHSAARPLSVWNANLVFCAAFAASAWLANIVLMRWPPRGRTRSGLSTYLKEGVRARLFACAAGAVCAIGNASQFAGGAWAGFATADLVQAFPLIGTLWGVFLFGDFRGASRRVLGLLVAMLTAYLAAVVLLALSVRSRSSSAQPPSAPPTGA